MFRTKEQTIDKASSILELVHLKGDVTDNDLDPRTLPLLFK